MGRTGEDLEDALANYSSLDGDLFTVFELHGLEVLEYRWEAVEGEQGVGRWIIEAEYPQVGMKGDFDD